MERERERERERHPRKRNQDQWTIVQRRKTNKSRTQATKTCFINHLPLIATISDVAKIFRTHGAIAEIVIPSTQKNPHHKFAFVQYTYPQSLATAIRDEHGRRMGNSRISVFPAKYDKPVNQSIPNPRFPHKNSQEKSFMSSNPHRNNMRDSRSYKEVANTKNPQTHPVTENDLEEINPITSPQKTPEPENNRSKPNPTKHRVMSSRLLGEDTERIRKALGEIDIDSEYAAAIKGYRCEENQEWLERSAIAITSSLQSAESIQDHIMSEGVNCLTVNSMGGMQHLLIFNTIEDKHSIMESKWLERWFLTIRDVDHNSKALWRETWIYIHGVPLIAWSYENFYNIGCIFGRVISVHYKQFDCAMIKLCTDCMFDINGKISMEVDERIYSVAISEKQHSWANGKNSHQHIQLANNDREQSNPTKTIPGMSPTNVKSDSVTEKLKRQPTNEDALIESKDNPKSDSLVPIQQQSVHNSPTKSPFHLENTNSPSQGIPTIWNTNHFGEMTDLRTNSPRHKKTVTTIYFSPTKKKPTDATKSSYPSQISPKINPTSQKSTLSPIKTSNTFGPLLRPSKTKTNSSSTLGSSSCSGPLFPPGFEDNIPDHTKREQVKKRMRKLEKKRKLKEATSFSQSSCPSTPLIHLPKTIQVDDVIQMANKLGLSFNGPDTELKRRIGVILSNQKLNWESGQI